MYVQLNALGKLATLGRSPGRSQPRSRRRWAGIILGSALALLAQAASAQSYYIRAKELGPLTVPEPVQVEGSEWPLDSFGPVTVQMFDAATGLLLATHSASLVRHCTKPGYPTCNGPKAFTTTFSVDEVGVSRYQVCNSLKFKAFSPSLEPPLPVYTTLKLHLLPNC